MKNVIASTRLLILLGLFGAFAFSSPAVARIIPPYMSWSEDPHTTITISWERDEPGRGFVHYGSTTNLGATVVDGDCRLRHTFTLRDLEPGTLYYYRAESTDGFQSDVHTFRTAPPATSSVYRVAVFADTQQPSDFSPATNHSRVVAGLLDRNPDVYIMPGDLVWDNDWSFWDDWFERQKDLLARTPIMPCLGNHEVFTVPHGATHFWDLFQVPDHPGNRRHFAFTYGNTRYIALDTENDVAGQNDFLTRELQAAAYDPDIVWTIVYCQRTVYPWTDKHGRFTPAYDNWVPIISQYGADVVFMGHNHIYQRAGPFRDVYYVTTGGGGGDPTAGVGVPPDVVSTTAYHFVEMNIDGNVMDYRAIRWDGEVMDAMVLTNRGRIVKVSPAFPIPGEPVRITYDAEQGPLAGASQIHLHLGIDTFAGPEIDTPMSYDPVTGLWAFDGTVPAHATQRIAFVFRDQDDQWHSNHTWDSQDLNWQALLGPVPAAPPPATSFLPVAVPGSPDISGPAAPGPNHPGDNVDINLDGGALAQNPAGTGFGNLGRIYVNVDATNLYISGIDAFLSATTTNNAFALFLGVDTLTDDAYHLWNKTGSPQLLDHLHNLVFTEPMDIAILFGDEYADGGSFPDFNFGSSGYNFGQGAFYLDPNTPTFTEVPGFRISQFDGTNQVPTATNNDDGNRRTERWEAAIPWTSLNAPDGARSISCLNLAGIIVSRSTNGNDRYLSGQFMGDRAYGHKDAENNYAFNVMHLTPAPVAMPHADVDFDGLPNAWKHRHFGAPTGPGPEEDPDNDGYDNWHEFIAGTQPTNATSLLDVHPRGLTNGLLQIAWPAVTNRTYDVRFRPDLTDAPAWSLAENVSAIVDGEVTFGITPPAGAGVLYLRVTRDPNSEP